MRTLSILAALSATALAAPAAAEGAATGASLIDFCVEALAAGDATAPDQVDGAISDTIEAVAAGSGATPGSGGSASVITVSTASFATPVDPVFMVYNWGETEGALGYCEVGFATEALVNAALTDYRGTRTREPAQESWNGTAGWSALFEDGTTDIAARVDTAATDQIIVRLEAQID
ncbi:MAG: hypothetical protein ACU0BS_13160 [Hasllibacter sp.]